jgi:phosphoglycerol transferase MdoB-like AlkP superfamily enzyme
VFKRGKYVFLFIVLNLIIVYFATSFNEYIVSFNDNFFSILYSFLGNLSILLILAKVGKLLFRKEKSYSMYLLITTFILNAFIFLVIYFTRNYKVMFSFNTLTIFRNPDAGFASQVILDGVKEIFIKGKIIIFVPFIVLLLIYLFKKRKSVNKLKRRTIKTMCVIIFSILISMVSLKHFRQKLKEDWNYTADIAQYGCQMCGFYTFYFYEIIGFDFNSDIESSYDELPVYNKNQELYTNVIDNNSYTNIKEGCLEGKNLFIIQAESLQTFAIDFKYNNEYIMPNMMNLLANENTFYFDNAYSVVGLGNTSDAEFAVLTGYYPPGNKTIAWDAYDNLFQVTSLPDLFPDNYIKRSYNPTLEEFYAHNYIHKNVYHFDNFIGLETFKNRYPYEKNIDLYYKTKWTTDKAILNYALEDAVIENNKGNNFFSFVETITPHYPFDDLSSKINDFQFIKNTSIDSKFENYLNQLHYNDEVIVDFINEASLLLPDTLFVIYGDHGNTLDKKSYEIVLNKKLSELEYRKILLNVPIIFYDPSGIMKDNLNDEIILNKTCSQIDLYRTIIDIFNLKTNDSYFGVNFFSNEPSFAIDPKNFDIITDSFMYSLKNKEYVIYDDTKYSDMIKIIDSISYYKSLNDGYILELISSKHSLFE